MKNINYQLVNRTTKPVLPDNLGFGQIFTDHMFEMDYSPSKGWHNYSIKPVKKLEMHPATMVIHYGQAAFEGLKAFKTIKDEVVIFRPDRHFVRINNSSRRLCMPEVDVATMVDVLKELVKIDKDWIPTKKGEALYIRPYIFGNDEVLGVRPSTNYKFIILLSPVGAYYPEGFKPVRILVTDELVRAVRKGMGECKTPGNYAASLLGQEIARREGYSQVLWLDAVELKYFEEVGTMNLFVHFEDEVVTPVLSGGILPGITRMSVLQILKDWGMNVNERLLSIEEFVKKFDAGKVKSVFGTGTAAIISSVGELKFHEKIMKINGGNPGELDVKLFEELTSIQYGIKPDKYHWLTHVES